jgi:hypothetical protein
MKTPPPNHLAAWLSDPRAAQYLGRAFVLKIQVLDHLITRRGSLAAIAREHGVTDQAVGKHAKRARRFYAKATLG